MHTFEVAVPVELRNQDGAVMVEATADVELPVEGASAWPAG